MYIDLTALCCLLFLTAAIGALITLSRWLTFRHSQYDYDSLRALSVRQEADALGAVKASSPPGQNTHIWEIIAAYEARDRQRGTCQAEPTEDGYGWRVTWRGPSLSAEWIVPVRMGTVRHLSTLPPRANGTPTTADAPET